MIPDDWEKVRAIYLEGIATGNATFETTAPSWEEWDSAHLAHSRLVARASSDLAAWAALSPVSRREVYAGVAEVSIYVKFTYRGQGIGRALLAALITESERHGIWTLQAGISLRTNIACFFTNRLDFARLEDVSASVVWAGNGAMSRCLNVEA